MAESKALLSQREIDALVNFLKANNSVSIGGVLDQKSIDKLIELVKYNSGQGIFVTTSSDATVISTDTMLLDLSSTIEEQHAECVLQYSINKNGYAEIICENNKTGNLYRITPASLEGKKYLPDDDSKWGFAIPPKIFQQVAKLLGVGYTPETLATVCSSFAKLMYGNADADIPSFYLTSED